MNPSMKKTLFLLPVLFSLYACFEVKKVEIPADLQTQLDASKPTVIEPAEINGVAQEIGDSLIKTITFNQDTLYKLGEHKIQQISKGKDKEVDKLLEAFEYSLEQNPKFKMNGIVKYARTDSVANYQNVRLLEDSSLKMVYISVNLEEVNQLIVQSRKKKH